MSEFLGLHIGEYQPRTGNPVLNQPLFAKPTLSTGSTNLPPGTMFGARKASGPAGFPPAESQALGLAGVMKNSWEITERGGKSGSTYE